MLLVNKVSGQLVVQRFSKNGFAVGLKQGMPLVLAKALLPDATVADFDPLKDFSSLYKLALWANKFAPFVGVDTELLLALKQKNLKALDITLNGLTCDIGGTGRLYKSEKALAESLYSKITAQGIELRIAIASTLGAAWALSRYGTKQYSYVDSECTEEALAELPIQALRISAEPVSFLNKLGIYQVKDLLKLPRRALPVRFGSEITDRLDLAFGKIDEPLNVLRPVETFCAKRSFGTPILKQESLKTVVLELLKKITESILKKGKKALGFKIVLECLDENFETFTAIRELGLHAASNNFSHLSSVIQPTIESIRTAHGVKSVTLMASGATKLTTSQFSLPEEGLSRTVAAQEGVLPLDELLNNFVVRLGKENVATLELSSSHTPEKSFAFRPKGSELPGQESAPKAKSFLSTNHTRPTFLFPRPEPAVAIAALPDSPPVFLRWRNRKLKIVSGSGPEKISSEWWHKVLCIEDGDEREYFRIQDHTGRWLWIFRNRKTLSWFVHGVWA